MCRVSVILPTYNESGNIGSLIEEILSYLPEDSEIIVVDDDSPDRTWEVAAAWAQQDPRVLLIRRIGRRGLTTAIQEGFERSRGEVIFWMDCDFSHPPDKIPEMIEKLSRYDVVVASRYIPGGAERGHSRLGSFLSRVICGLSSLILSPAIKDYTSGYVGLRRPVLEAIPLRGDYGEYCIDLLYRAHTRGYRIVEIPYRCLPRRSGESKTATRFSGYLKRGYKYIFTLVRLRFGA
ncbi:MAG: polyprenol monophosphomannose synthase [Deltaproteobacteria bacterium]|nr:polyprenol monophosphomannose synthase [Deltaproteobacteria bacterium]